MEIRLGKCQNEGDDNLLLVWAGLCLGIYCCWLQDMQIAVLAFILLGYWPDLALGLPYLLLASALRPPEEN